MTKEVIVSGDAKDWMQRCVDSLKSSGFTRVATHPSHYQIDANYKKLITWGTIQVTFAPEENNTKITAVSKANVDNIYALFKSPNKTILSKFMEGLPR